MSCGYGEQSEKGVVPNIYEGTNLIYIILVGFIGLGIKNKQNRGAQVLNHRSLFSSDHKLGKHYYCLGRELLPEWSSQSHNCLRNLLFLWLSASHCSLREGPYEKYDSHFALLSRSSCNLLWPIDWDNRLGMTVYKLQDWGPWTLHIYTYTHKNERQISYFQWHEVLPGYFIWSGNIIFVTTSFENLLAYSCRGPECCFQ